MLNYRHNFHPTHEIGVFHSREPFGFLSFPTLVLTSIATARVISPLSESNAVCARESGRAPATTRAQVGFSAEFPYF